MLNFFKKKNKSYNNETNQLLLKTASLLIHAAKIDENYTNKEKDIVKKTLIKLGTNEDKIDQIMNEAEKNEKNSNQILDFTREIKNSSDDYKIKIVESLWSIIYSNNEADMYEANLMRRLSGLLYLDNKIVGDIKEKIKKNLIK
ncbi:MAG: Tellurite resistance protein TerB [Candidatus Pelagibacter sp.]|nr:Tellurite resistance protein TerB [Candidatus Pelagibacter sp.]|tara:strand:- start:1446 stop:1877 length:432 start_codon:yes stop_codon:yes gene_type:complete